MKWLSQTAWIASWLVSGLNLVAVTHSDDLGRPYLTRTTPDVGAKPAWNDGDPEAVGNVVKRLRYPASTADRHRYEAVSNPYRAGQIAGQGWTRTRIDPLGRTVDVTTYAITTPGAMPPPWSGTDTNLVGVTLPGNTAFTHDADVTTVTACGLSYPLNNSSGQCRCHRM